MLQKSVKIFLVCALLFVSASISFAQEETHWKIGDKVEIRNLSKEWVPGTIIGTLEENGKLLYRVQLDDANAPNVYFNRTEPADIRPRGGQPVVNQPVADSHQEGTQWKVGDKVEIRNLSKEWVPGTIIGTLEENGKLLYRVQLDDPNAPVVYFNRTYPADIRPRGGQPVVNQPATDNHQAPKAGGAFKVGDRVDTFYDENRGHNRGTVIEVGDRKYKVHYTGCTKIFDEWVDASLVQAAATISADAPEIKFLFGKWQMTTVGSSRAGMAWGKSPGIQINGDGTYIWYQDGEKPPVKGKWTTDAKVPKLNEGTPKFDGVVVKDAEGNEWKAFRWIVKSDAQDGIEIDRMCSGMSEVGTRVR